VDLAFLALTVVLVIRFLRTSGLSMRRMMKTPTPAPRHRGLVVLTVT